jgi:hypothetical protein
LALRLAGLMAAGLMVVGCAALEPFAGPVPFVEFRDRASATVQVILATAGPDPIPADTVAQYRDLVERELAWLGRRAPHPCYAQAFEEYGRFLSRFREASWKAPDPDMILGSLRAGASNCG